MSDKVENIVRAPVVEDENPPEVLQPPPHSIFTDDLNNISTISTKLSTDQLICKSPSSGSSKSLGNNKTSYKNNEKITGDDDRNDYNYCLYLGCLQFVFGVLMAGFGISVIVHNSSLSQIGGGIWGGCLVMATGISGVLAAAKSWCPLNSTPQKIAHTSFLALSLMSLAVAQLIAAIAATGLGRDINISQSGILTRAGEELIEDVNPPENYMSAVWNIGLLLVSIAECILAGISSYKSSRSLCPCFRKRDEDYAQDFSSNQRHALVSSWLGKHNPPLYIVGTPSTLGGKSTNNKLNLTPVFALPPPQAQIIGVPLIPAPLGSIPPPPPSRSNNRFQHQRRNNHLRSNNKFSREKTPISRRSKSKSQERIFASEEDLTKTYTGLDKMMAEEFIDICDSRNASLCSGCSDSSEIASSRDYLVNKM